MSEKTYEVLEPVRIHRRSRDVGARVVAHPDHVADLVGSGVLREVGDVDCDRSILDGAQLEADANPGTSMDATQSGASDGHEDGSQGGEGTAPSMKATVDLSDALPATTPTKPAAKPSGTKPGAKRGAASKVRK
ncbi:hypothetical protein [Burkholderia pseudomallei]|uniref:hypothetical protein n=1 Tax=Burkholderia pseudomallei TaxID=28450 RepID=UPI000A1A0A96|nr:hypothetical protein [Burkholderia pseudomallei]ARL27784.1 hypothetical protein BOC47_25110 [Burkholderia pseudomallei]